MKLRIAVILFMAVFMVTAQASETTLIREHSEPVEFQTMIMRGEELYYFFVEGNKVLIIRTLRNYFFIH